MGDAAEIMYAFSDGIVRRLDEALAAAAAEGLCK